MRAPTRAKISEAGLVARLRDDAELHLSLAEAPKSQRSFDCAACRLPWRLHTSSMKDRCRAAFPLQQAVAALEGLRERKERGR